MKSDIGISLRTMLNQARELALCESLTPPSGEFHAKTLEIQRTFGVFPIVVWPFRTPKPKGVLHAKSYPQAEIDLLILHPNAGTEAVCEIWHNADRETGNAERVRHAVGDCIDNWLDSITPRKTLLSTDSSAQLQEAVEYLEDLLASSVLSRAAVQRRAVELLIDYECRLPIPDLAKDTVCNWAPEDYDNNTSTLLGGKRLKKHFSGRFGVRTESREIVVTIDGKAVRR